jgi:hypothetical protein
MARKEVMDFYSKDHTTVIYTLYGENAEDINVKEVVDALTTLIEMIILKYVIRSLTMLCNR